MVLTIFVKAHLTTCTKISFQSLFSIIFMCIFASYQLRAVSVSFMICFKHGLFFSRTVTAVLGVTRFRSIDPDHVNVPPNSRRYIPVAEQLVWAYTFRGVLDLLGGMVTGAPLSRVIVYITDLYGGTL